MSDILTALVLTRSVLLVQSVLMPLGCQVQVRTTIGH